MCIRDRLAAVSAGVGDRCGLVTFDTEVRSVVAASGRTDQAMRMTEAMYALKPALAESDYAGAFATTVARFRRRALLVVLTDLCLLYTSPSPRDRTRSRMPSSA